MNCEIEANLYELSHEVYTEGQNEVVNMIWKIPDETVKETLLRNQLVKELNTNRYEFAQEIDEDLKLRLRIKILGTTGKMVQIYYLAPQPVFLQIILKNSNNYVSDIVDCHWVQAKKWQFLKETNTSNILFNSSNSKSNYYLHFTFKISRRSHNETDKENDSFPKAGLSHDLEYLLNNQMLSDLVIKSNDGVEFNAHKLIMTTRSDVFKAHFDHNMVESTNGVVETPLESEVLEAMLMYIYTDNVPKGKEIADKLLKAADFYHLNGLKYICEKALQPQLTVDNVMETLQFAHTYMAENLTRYCLEFINDDNAKSIIETKSWEEASPEIIKTVAEYIIKNNF